MILIKDIFIKGFRSFKSQSISNIGNLTSLVGKNSCGKSNVLRALNLFFNDQVEPGQSVDFSSDYHEKPKSRQKKVMEVAVTFSLPPTFNFRNELKHMEKLGSSFVIKRTWQLDPRRIPFSTYSIECTADIDAPEDVARQFLSLVSYRYVPNGTAPSHVIESESKALADSIFWRLKGDESGAALLKSLGTASRSMLASASESFEAIGSPLSDPQISRSDNIGEMLSMVGFQAVGAHGLPVSDLAWGHGHQAFFLFQMLHLLDTNYGRFFGWKQGTIWGIEEPESALHRDLESQLAARIRDWADDNKSRLQVLQTTHSPIFSMASDRGYWIELDGPESIVLAMPLPELAVAAEQKGVTGWLHPALAFPWNPVVLVEGGIDSRVLSHIADLTENSHLRFVTVRDFEDGEGSGKDAMIKWLRQNKKYIPNRQPSCPLIAVFDWEVSDQDITKARSAYGPEGNLSVLRMDSTHCNPKMGTDIVGIERFYPPSVFEESKASGMCVYGESNSTGVISISKPALNAAKGDLVNRLVKIDDISMLAPLNSAFCDILNAINAELDLH